jgi:bidirectional [NiFe] hydrogenase diaphorase subunit
MPQKVDSLERLLRRFGGQSHGLIELLNAAQERDGYLSEPLLRDLAQRLQLPLSRVQATASFYHLFRFTPPTPHRCRVCTGTACFVQGGGQLLAELQQQPLSSMGVELGQVRCIGTCSGAPLVVVDEEVWNHQSGETVLAGLRRLRT